MPLSPCCFHCRFDGRIVFPAVPIAVMILPKDSGMGCPARLSSAGFGSNRSIWLGPPSMKRKMTDFAVGLWCGCFAFNGLTVAACSTPSRFSNDARAIAPRPLPALARKSRRDVARRLWMDTVQLLIPVNEFVRVQHGMAEIDQRSRLRAVYTFRDPRWRRDLLARGDSLRDDLLVP